MEKRTFVNPAINDAATFLKTAAETNGAYTLLEIDLGKSDGPPLHYHKAFSEKFQVQEGILYLQVGKQKKILKAGESVTVPAGTPHRFYNEANDQVKFQITLQPGHTGMENFIKIFYGLAADGLTDEKGKPKKFAHLAVALIISDSNAPGWMSLLSPLIRAAARRAKKDGTEKWLLDRYCSA
ncbi:cupin domain-containing protein [Ferruginibacter paludis]|uniref:cupin domain-containing protein n=1 Tax=Ferruginibacter paludis TaxID=1310417 RepID=UPI0025B2A487|nr:cupin domain-containing protein [Ferruginibacter paludis]MDN3657217.1 cupin domain-containing protein [Ferruginibacter paludis]